MREKSRIETVEDRLTGLLFQVAHHEVLITKFGVDNDKLREHNQLLTSRQSELEKALVVVSKSAEVLGDEILVESNKLKNQWRILSEINKPIGGSIK